MGPALELSVVDLKSVGADRLGTEAKLKSLGEKDLICTFETVGFTIRWLGRGVLRPGKWGEIPFLGIHRRQENLGCWLAGVCWRALERSQDNLDWRYKANWGTAVI